jgi:hypothetical protein
VTCPSLGFSLRSKPIAEGGKVEPFPVGEMRMAASRKTPEEMAEANRAKEFVPEVMTEREIGKALGGEVVATTVTSLYPAESLGALDSFDAALVLANETHGLTMADQEPSLGDGFRVASEDDKRRLIGIPLLLLEWSFRESDYGSDQEWVIIRAVQRGENGEAIKWVITDGSTGIAKDLQTFSQKTGKTGGLMVKRGLQESKYYIDGNKESAHFGTALSKKVVREYMADGRGKHLAEASTFYLDTSA